jgi:NAD(P)-dependent dehydrogenase (short-subunit alcohol dehydrogenase family)
MTFENTDQLLNLSGRAAIVTGAARGIGLGIARRLANAGANVVMCDINAQALETAAAGLRGEGYSPAVVSGDITKAECISAIVDTCTSTFGRLDILVNNAGLRDWRQWETLSEADWDRFMNVNTKAVFFLSQAAAKVMVAQGHGGSIVNIASTAAQAPVRFRIDYNTAKAGVVALTKSLALELGQHMIRVNAVGPGGTQSEGGSGSVPQWVMTSGSLNYMDRLAMPAGLLDPDDIARGVLFFCGDISRFVTGQTLFVDAGYLVG